MLAAFVLMAEAARPAPPAPLMALLSPTRCVSDTPDEIVVCRGVERPSPYRYPGLAAAPDPGLFETHLGNARVSGGGPKGSVGITLSIPF